MSDTPLIRRPDRNLGIACPQALSALLELRGQVGGLLHASKAALGYGLWIRACFRRAWRGVPDLFRAPVGWRS